MHIPKSQSQLIEIKEFYEALEESKIQEDKNIDLAEKLKEEQKLREKAEKELEELKKWKEENE